MNTKKKVVYNKIKSLDCVYEKSKLKMYAPL